MNDFSLNDAAVADEVLSNVPNDKTDDELAKRSFPSEFDDLLQQYRALQDKVAQQGTKPNTTVAQDIKGLIALNNKLSSQVKNGIQAASMAQQGGQPPQGQMPPMPPQGGQPPQGQMPPMPPQGQMPPMPPQGGPPDMGAGVPTLNAGVMQNPQFANGGIVAFANTGAVENPNPTPMDFSWMSKDRKYSKDIPLDFNSASQQSPDQNSMGAGAGPSTNMDIPTPQPQSQPKPEPQPQIDTSDQAPQANPFQSDSDLAAMRGTAKDIQKQFSDAINKVNEMEIYSAGTDPSIKMKREELVSRKLANDNQISQDRWDGLVAAGLAMMEEASKPRLPGEANALTFYSAGMKAGYNKLNAINEKYKADQNALDDQLIELSHQEYLAQETNKKEEIAAKNKRIETILNLQNQALQSTFEFQKALATFALQKDQNLATRENTRAQLEATKDYRASSQDLEKQKAISASVDRELQSLVGQTLKDSNGKERVITVNDLDTLRPQLVQKKLQEYNMISGRTNIAPSGGAGASNVRSAADKILAGG